MVDGSTIFTRSNTTTKPFPPILINVFVVRLIIVGIVIEGPMILVMLMLMLVGLASHILRVLLSGLVLVSMISSYVIDIIVMNIINLAKATLIVGLVVIVKAPTITSNTPPIVIHTVSTRPTSQMALSNW